MSTVEEDAVEVKEEEVLLADLGKVVVSAVARTAILRGIAPLELILTVAPDAPVGVIAVSSAQLSRETPKDWCQGAVISLTSKRPQLSAIHFPRCTTERQASLLPV